MVFGFSTRASVGGVDDGRVGARVAVGLSMSSPTFAVDKSTTVVLLPCVSSSSLLK